MERGAVLRCFGSYPYEEIVDFMIVELPFNGRREYALMVISGYKAGLIFVILPDESYVFGENGGGVNVEWLRANWSKWGYFECPVEQVQVFTNFPKL